MREKLETLTIDKLKDLCKSVGIKCGKKTKDELIDDLVVYDENKKKEQKMEKPKMDVKNDRKILYDDKEYLTKNIGGSCEGILEIVDDLKCGFIRCENFLPGNDDVYVSAYQIRRYDLRTGDIVSGYKKVQDIEKEKFPALLKIMSINGVDVSNVDLENMKARPRFDKLTPIFPDKRLRLLSKGDTQEKAMRVLDLLSPIGKGQRGLIVSPPKAGKTTLLKMIAKSLLKYNNDIHLMILLVDERPEEVTDMKREVSGDNVDIIYSTFDEQPERHKRVAEMVIERAKRLVEEKRDVVILLDSITRLTRAYNLYTPTSGRTLSGGLDPASFHMPKKFFGAARNMKEGGSLTILATALVDTGSRMDDVIYEEFKGTGNMELVLNRKLQERRVFPAIDIQKSGTRKEELLLNELELNASNKIHRMLNDVHYEEKIERILDLFDTTKDNDEFIHRLAQMEG